MLLKSYKVQYTVFGNFSSHKTIEMFPEVASEPTYNTYKNIVWNLIKDEDWDWPIHYEELSINKVNEVTYEDK